MARGLRKAGAATGRFADVVQLRSAGSFGSGYLIGEGLVLTALHCVRDRKTGAVFESLGGYLLRDLVEGREEHLSAEVAWPDLGTVTENGPDLAVLRLTTKAPPTPQSSIPYGAVPLAPTSGFAVGFPTSSEGNALPGGAIEESIPGRVHLTSSTRHALSLFPDMQAATVGTKRYRGLSGGPLFVGDAIVGVMREVPEGWRGARLDAEPLAPLFEANKALRDLLAPALPLLQTHNPEEAALAAAYEVIGRRSLAASERVAKRALNVPLRGRARDLEALIAFLEAQDRGILLLSGEAGMGKTALALGWGEDQAAAPGTVVLRHVFSLEADATVTTAEMVDNLVHQAVDLLGPATLGAGDPGDSNRLRSRMEHLVSTDQPEGRRLILILDGLDEARDRITPWENRLGRGVYQVVTCRGAGDDVPDPLRPWITRAEENEQPLHHHRLAPLDDTGIAAFLGADVSAARLAALKKASGGVPLFLSLLAADEDAGGGGFGAYALRELEKLRDRLERSADAWTWGISLRLLASLSVARGPLPAPALAALIGLEALDGMPPALSRWLWRRPAARGRGTVLSFPHPRLQALFAEVLPDSAPDRPVLIEKAEETLIAAASGAWAEDAPITAYALAHLPAHHLARGETGAAARLLSDPRFLRARLIAAPSAATLQGTVEETTAAGLEDWAAFWAIAGRRCELSLRLSAPREEDEDTRGQGLARVFAQLAADILGNAHDGPHLNAPLGAEAPSIVSLTAIEDGALALDINGHLIRWPEGEKVLSGITGVIEGPDGRFLAAGRDGRLTPLSSAGERLGATRLKAHERPIVGAKAVADGFVTSAEDGSVKRWNARGRALTPEDALRHGRAAQAVLPWRGGFVSWAKDGSILFWSDEAPKGRVIGPYPGPLSGVLPLGDLLSWSPDGALHFWKSSGSAARAPARIMSETTGAIATPTGFATWGQDGAVLWWSKDGRPRRGGSVAAHRGPVLGMRALGDSFVSWGADGRVRFWSADGAPQTERPAPAHYGYVGGLIPWRDGAASFGSDGTLVFWRADSTTEPPYVAPTFIQAIAARNGNLWLALGGRVSTLAQAPIP